MLFRSTGSWPFSDCPDWASIDFSSARPSRELCESLSATSTGPANESLSSHRMGSSSLEARMERIMDVVKEMDFDNMDAMISAYYRPNSRKTRSPTGRSQQVDRVAFVSFSPNWNGAHRTGARARCRAIARRRCYLQRDIMSTSS